MLHNKLLKEKLWSRMEWNCKTKHNNPPNKTQITAALKKPTFSPIMFKQNTQGGLRHLCFFLSLQSISKRTFFFLKQLSLYFVLYFLFNQLCLLHKQPSQEQEKISRNGFFFFELSCFLLLSLFYEVILFIYFFLAVLYSTWDLSFPTWMEPARHSVEGGVLTTGPPGSPKIGFLRTGFY